MKEWVVGKAVASRGIPFIIYLKHSHLLGLNMWVEECNATPFTFWEACWQGLRHRAWPMRK